MSATSNLEVRVMRMPVKPHMKLTDVNGVRLVLGVGTRAATREMESLMWTWDIAVHTGRNQKKMTRRSLVDEVVNKTGDDVVLQTPTQIIDRLLGARREWSVADVANLLLCTVEHVYALLESKALNRCTKKGEPIRIARATLEQFLVTRLVNKG